MTITTTDELAVLRGRTKRPGRFLSFCPRTEAVRGVVAEVLIDENDGGVYGLILQDGYVETFQGISGMTVDVGTTPGADDIGRIRLRRPSGVAVEDGPYTVMVNHISTGEFPVAAGHFITIRDEFLPHQVSFMLLEHDDGDGNLIGVDEFFDYDIDMNIPHDGMVPKANITAGTNDDGSPKLVRLADWEDSEGLGYREITVSSDWAYANTAGKAIVTTVWNIRNCVYVGDSVLTDATITIRVPTGFHHIILLVYDEDGYSNYMALPLATHDDSYLPITLDNITSDATEDDRELAFEFNGQANEVSPANLPRQTTTIYWEVPGWSNGPKPKAYRDQALAWMFEDAPVLAHNGVYRLRTGTLQWWMDHFDGPNQLLRDPHEMPDRAFELRDLTFYKVINFQLWAISTVPMIANIFKQAPLTSAITDEVEFPLGTIWTQNAEVAQRFQMSRIMLDSCSNVWLVRDFQYLSEGERVALTPLLSLDARDLGEKGIELVRRLAPNVAQVDAAGSIFDENHKPIIYQSVAPGKVKSAGVNQSTLPGQYLPPGAPQAYLSQLNGAHWAFLNREISDFPLPLVDDYDVVEPCWQRPIKITWQEDTVHGTILTDYLCMVTRVEVEHSFDPDDLEKPPKSLNWTLQPVTGSRPGQAVETKQQVDVIQPGDQAVPPPVDDSFPVAGIGLDATEAKAWWATSINPLTGGSTEEEHSNGKTGIGGVGYSNPYNPNTFFAFPSSGGVGVEMCEDQSSLAGHHWSVLLTPTQLYGDPDAITFCAHGHIGTAGYGIAFGSNGTRAVTHDNWQTVTRIVGGNFTSSTPISRNAGHILMARVPQNCDDAEWWLSTDGGLTDGTKLIGFPICASGHGTTNWNWIFAPYVRPDGGANLDNAGLMAFPAWATAFGSAAGATYAQSNDRLTTVVGIDSIGGAIFTAERGANILSCHTWDAGRIAYVNDSTLGITNDGGVTKTYTGNIFGGGVGLTGVQGWPCIGTDDPDVGVWVPYSKDPMLGGAKITFDNGTTFYALSIHPCSYFELTLIGKIPNLEAA